MRAPLALVLVSSLAAACSSSDGPNTVDAGPLNWDGAAPTLADGSTGIVGPFTGLDAGLGGDAGLRDGNAVDAQADAAPVDLSSFDWKPGDYPPDPHAQTYLALKGVAGQKNKTRGYKVHVPKGYSAATPAPLVFAFHGYQQNAVMFGVEGSSFIAKSDAEGFVLVMPNGVQEDGVGGSWNAGACCGEASAQRLDDVGLIRAMFAEVQKHVRVDTARVYATGLSNGGFMSYRLACEAADLFAAVAPVAGSIGTPELAAISTNSDPDFKACAPSRAISVLAVHGNGDPIVPYAGMKPSLDLFAGKNGCSATTAAAAQPVSGGDTTCVSYGGCSRGAEVTGCTVEAGGHCWFGDDSCGTGAPGIGNLVVGNNSSYFKTTDAVWDFLKRFHR